MVTPTARQMPEMPASIVSFDTTEGTFMNVDVSPDAGTLIFDLLGDVYSLPFAGGQAVPLTSGRAWDQAPRFSPDGASVYFVSDRDGYNSIWRLRLSDQSLQPVTRLDSDIVGGPNWSQDGRHLVAAVADPQTSNTEFVLHAIDPDNGTTTAIDAPSGRWIDMDTFETFRRPVRIFSGVESADGDVYFSQSQLDQDSSRISVRMHEFDRHTQTRSPIMPLDASYSEYKPQLSKDGKLLAYFRQYSDRRTEIRIRNRATGQDESVIELSNADDASYYAEHDSRPNYAFTPDSEQLIYWHGGKIQRLTLANGSREIIPFRVQVEREVWDRAQPAVKHLNDAGEASIIRWPSVSRDGKTMAFAAIGYVWVIDLKSGSVRRLTRSNDFEYMPALSPDGRFVAYTSFALADGDFGPGRLMVADVVDETQRELLADPNTSYLLPKWSQDGSMIALVREVEGEGGVDAAFGWTPMGSRDFHDVAPAPATGDRLSYFIYARFVGFDESDRRLLFSFPRSRSEVVVATAGLDGADLQTLAISTSEVGGIVPASDLQNFALTRRDGTVWVVRFSAGDEPSAVSTLVPEARRVSSGGGYYVDWNRPTQLTFGYAQKVYRYSLDNGALESFSVKVPFSKPMAQRPTAFVGARLIIIADDVGAGPMIESGTVIVDGSRISAIGPVGDVVVPADALIINVAGSTIMPGLIDTHYHRIGGWGISAFRLPNADFADRSAISYGVTTAWEPGGPPNDAVPAMVDLQEAGRVAGPRWSHSAMGTVGYPWELLTSYSAAFAAVKQHRELGVDVLKEYNTPTRQQRQWLSAAAHQMGLGIVSHIGNFTTMMTGIIDGFTGGDHPYVPVPFYRDVNELLRQTGYIWTPNILITPGIVGSGQRRKNYWCYAVLEWQDRTSPGVREADPICPPDSVDISVPYDTQRFSRVARQAASAASTGVHIGVSAHGMPGSNLHWEMWLLWKGGLPIDEVLRAATIGNAKKLGLQEEIGSLKPGKIADFVVLEDNPLDNVLNTLSLKYTVQGGAVYNSATALPVDLNSVRETDFTGLYEGK